MRQEKLSHIVRNMGQNININSFNVLKQIQVTSLGQHVNNNQPQQTYIHSHDCMGTFVIFFWQLF